VDRLDPGDDAAGAIAMRVHELFITAAAFAFAAAILFL
jgi:hypothetical protein